MWVGVGLVASQEGADVEAVGLNKGRFGAVFLGFVSIAWLLVSIATLCVVVVGLFVAIALM